MRGEGRKEGRKQQERDGQKGMQTYKVIEKLTFQIIFGSKSQDVN